MHWVERGPEPPALAGIREEHTQAFVDYYKGDRASKPQGKWRRFHAVLRDRFHCLCAYCEETCPGEVEHFQPQSKYPQMVYVWENWLFACHSCNHSKAQKWPRGGYVDPCSASHQKRPERFFSFEPATCEIIAKPGISGRAKAKARRMIRDLKLNGYARLKKRVNHQENVKFFSFAVDQPGEIGSRAHDALKKSVSRNVEFSSLARLALADRLDELLGE